MFTTFHDDAPLERTHVTFLRFHFFFFIADDPFVMEKIEKKNGKRYWRETLGALECSLFLGGNLGGEVTLDV